MVHIVWLAGVVTAVMGIAILFKPIWMRLSLIFMNKGKHLYAGAGLKIILGVLFLILATQCTLPGVIITLGILMAGGTIVFCLLAIGKIHTYINWWIARPFWLYRVWGLLAALLGGLIMYAGVPTSL